MIDSVYSSPTCSWLELMIIVILEIIFALISVIMWRDSKRNGITNAYEEIQSEDITTIDLHESINLLK